MAYTEFQTDNADYVLQLGNHALINRHNVFDGIDALVMENTAKEIGIGSMFGAEVHPQMALPIKYAKKNEVPVFMTDVPVTAPGYWREILAQYLSIPVFPIEIFYGHSRRKVNNIIGRFLADYTFSLQGPTTAGRNALNAEKIEKFVVPRVREISGKERPRIGMVYGFGHIGLEYHLRSERRRKFTLWNWRSFNFGKWEGFDKEGLNKVYEGKCHFGLWDFKEHDLDLF